MVAVIERGVPGEGSRQVAGVHWVLGGLLRPMGYEGVDRVMPYICANMPGNKTAGCDIEVRPNCR